MSKEIVYGGGRREGKTYRLRKIKKKRDERQNPAWADFYRTRLINDRG